MPNPANSRLSCYQFVSDSAEYSFIFNDFGSAWRTSSLSSDAKYVCHKRGSRPSDEELIFCDGSYAAIDGGVELCTSIPVTWAELIVHENGRRIHSSDKSAILEPAPESSEDTASAMWWKR